MRIQETKKNMKKFLAKSTKGIVSLYFLGFLLYVSLLCSIVLGNDYHRIKAIENMKEDTIYFQQEKLILDNFRLILQKEQIDKDTCPFEIHDGTAYYSVEGEYQELLIIYFDPQTKEIFDFDVERMSK